MANRIERGNSLTEFLSQYIYELLSSQVDFLNYSEKIRTVMRPKVNFREIPFKSGEYEAECRLRNELLRKPLGLSLWDEDLSVEFEQIHFGFFDDRDELVACAVAQPLNGKEAKVRQVVVKEQDQRVGLGSRLMEEVEKSLKERGFERIALHSRRTVCDFYREQGYQIEGDVFEEVGLLHYRMSKLL